MLVLVRVRVLMLEPTPVNQPLTWRQPSVNGIRNPFSYQPWREKRTFQTSPRLPRQIKAMFDILEADIVVLQETKIQRKDLEDDMILVPGWDVYLTLPRHKKGYSGVAIYTRNQTCAPIRAEEGLLGLLTAPKSSIKFRHLPKHQQIGGYPSPDQLSPHVDELDLDSEGRCLLVEFPAFVLMGVYCPAIRDESRHNFRISFLQALDARVRNLLDAGKQVVLAGDINIVRSQLDSTNLQESLRKQAMTMDEWMSLPARRIFNQLVFPDASSPRAHQPAQGPSPVLWDLCRCFHPDRQAMNTCWDTKRNTRPANNGSRIDYILCTDALKPWFTEADIQPGLMGSDHCPVFAVMADNLAVDGASLSLPDLVNPADMFSHGVRIRPWASSDCLPLSARLIPEFDRRQNIRDMFKKSAEHPFARQASQPKRLRSSSPPQPLTLPSKRSKPLTPLDSSNKTKTKTPAGQTTLQAFLAKPAPPASCPRNLHKPAADTQSLTPATPSATHVPPEPAASPERVFDPIEAKESWSRLLGKRIAPRCQHGEPCISLVTKKPGINCGRSFYICPRPLGPSGDKEKDSEWRCSTFIWSSDWNKTTS
ncbi:hypothetical protein CDD82_7281 [Ophiocordyceps australis]|uniref:DNA-(apurinic or apyrimidinic site) endonuclease 2 n=1 Tax=Ophiocordyceps australis TaxID=1399860 RepID=A0A2C5ZJ66_9HYPO|nr:hypothetical protein CDD82_7281 [Ophiocordyceps australis]